jgi:hypothetical protein
MIKDNNIQLDRGEEYVTFVWKGRHRREKNIKKDLKMAVNFRVPCEGRKDEFFDKVLDLNPPSMKRLV